MTSSEDSLDILYLLLSEGSSKFLLAIVHSCGLFLINIGEGTASLGAAVLPSVVEYLYDELDGVSDLMSPVQPLLTQRVYILTLPWHSWTPLDGKELG